MSTPPTPPSTSQKAALGVAPRTATSKVVSSAQSAPGTVSIPAPTPTSVNSSELQQQQAINVAQQVNTPISKPSSTFSKTVPVPLNTKSGNAHDPTILPTGARPPSLPRELTPGRSPTTVPVLSTKSAAIATKAEVPIPTVAAGLAPKRSENFVSPSPSATNTFTQPLSKPANQNSLVNVNATTSMSAVAPMSSTKTTTTTTTTTASQPLPTSVATSEIAMPSPAPRPTAKISTPSIPKPTTAVESSSLLPQHSTTTPKTKSSIVTPDSKASITNGLRPASCSPPEKTQELLSATRDQQTPTVLTKSTFHTIPRNTTTSNAGSNPGVKVIPKTPAEQPAAVIRQITLPLPRSSKRPRLHSTTDPAIELANTSTLGAAMPPLSSSSSNPLAREVFLLTGGQSPAPLVPSFPLSARPRRKVAWVHAPFSNPTRRDGLQLSHWARAGTPPEYLFHRFVRSVRIVTYTDDEYRRFVAPDPLSVTDAAAAADIKAVAAAKAKANAMKTTGGETTKSAKSLETTGIRPKNSGSSSSQVGTRAGPDAPPMKEPRLSTPSLRRRAASPPASAAASGANVTTPVTPPGPSPGTTKKGTVATVAVGGSLRQGMHQVPKQKGWTRGETDKLFELCEQFDLRFPVVQDRWPLEMRGRSIDELKNRYYSVAKLLLDGRAKRDPNYLSGLPAALQRHSQAIIMNPFDYEYECIRKNQLEWHYSRSKTELREEEETVREARRIEASRKRVAKERQRLARLLTPGGLGGVAGNTGNKSTDAALNATAPSVTPQKTFPHRKVTSGAFARSTMVYAPVTHSQKICKRIDAALNELGVALRPTPTATVVDIFDLLRMEITAFLELQRTVTKKEEDVHALRVKLAKLKGEPVPSPPPGVLPSQKKRRADDNEPGSLFGGPATTSR